MMDKIVNKVEERLTRKQACSECERRDSVDELQGSIEVILFLTELLRENLASKADYETIMSDAVIVTSEALNIARLAQRELIKNNISSSLGQPD